MIIFKVTVLFQDTYFRREKLLKNLESSIQGKLFGAGIPAKLPDDVREHIKGRGDELEYRRETLWFREPFIWVFGDISTIFLYKIEEAPNGKERRKLIARYNRVSGEMLERYTGHEQPQQQEATVTQLNRYR
jgi:hypothetical protein